MAKVAKIVLLSLMTRVIVDENATDIEIGEAAKGGCEGKLQAYHCNRST